MTLEDVTKITFTFIILVISSDNDVGPVAQPVTPEMGHDHHSGKRNREERRSKDKVKSLVYYLNVF